ncbi:hypothetical protein CTA1_2960 [Colletotrichum tanaceti]|uniref:Uncharacterized protein n=1 Tax=Colletotrichum tanaceti TaxID=1306861 RepID=A0A4V6DG91_9PEZI|nr:hypothetical protein CTA1_2960 [Colletotrichum tanaceti]
MHPCAVEANKVTGTWLLARPLGSRSESFRPRTSTVGVPAVICELLNTLGRPDELDVPVRPDDHEPGPLLESVPLVQHAVDVLVAPLADRVAGVDLDDLVLLEPAVRHELLLGRLEVLLVGLDAGEEEDGVVARARHAEQPPRLLAPLVRQLAVRRAPPAPHRPFEPDGRADDGAPPVLDGDLRDEGVDGPPPRRVVPHAREDPGHQRVADGREDGVLRRTDGEHAVRPREQVLADRVPLLVVGVEEGLVLLAADDGRQLPAEVDGVLDARVHALPAGGGVDVRGVAGEEQAAVAVPVDAAAVPVEAREPAGLLDLEPVDHDLPHKGLELGDVRVALALAARRALADHADDTAPEGEDDHDAAAEEEGDALGVVVAADLGVAEDVLLRVLRPIERHVGAVADDAVGAVAADDVLGTHNLFLGGGGGGGGALYESGAGADTVLLDFFGRDAALDGAAVDLQLAEHGGLGVGLGDPQGQREAGVIEAEIVKGAGDDVAPVAVDVDAGALCAGGEHGLGDVRVSVEQLLRAALDGEGARLVRGLGELVDDAEGDALDRELEGEGEARRAGADDEDICVTHLWRRRRRPLGGCGSGGILVAVVVGGGGGGGGGGGS